MTVMTLRARIEGGLLGLLVGDALGVPYEFHAAAELPPPAELEPTPPGDFRRAHVGTPPGTWSDDGAQALALLASLLERDGLDPEDLGRRLVGWYERGEHAVDGRVFDCGIQTARAVRAIAAGSPALAAASAESSANGNGSLMRVLPLALWHRGTDAELARDARLQSRVTHAHLRSQLCCALYVLWARRALEGGPDPWGAAVRALRAIIAADPVPASRAADEAELELHIRPDDATPGRGAGYVVDCLRSARWAVAQGSYEAVVKAAVSLGDDTDTTACVAGGIAGVRDGVAAIPARWLGALRGRELCDPLLARLIACRDP